METYLLDWTNLLLRWLHVITAIAWVGSSFYFVFLDSSLTPPTDPVLKEKGVGGELWAVHGGGFYNPQKYAVAPQQIPNHLHWFYWESYTTWLSGFALLSISYLYNANIYLVDKNVFAWGSSFLAGLTVLGLMLLFWLIYDTICRVFGQKPNGDATVGALIAVVVAGFAYLLCQLYSGRAAFLLMGAILATSMSANVLMWIIPGQKKTVADLKAGRPVNPIHGIRGKQRSVHNTYFTLPVLFAMLSNHYSFTYSHAANWVVLIAMMAAGALIRQFFVLRHAYKLGKRAHPWPYAVVGVAILVGLVIALMPTPPIEPSPSQQTDAGQPNSATIQAIVNQRCISCHNATLAQKNVRLDTPEHIAQNAQMAYQQVVVQKLMPLANATQMTDAERNQFKAWFEAGAKME